MTDNNKIPQEDVDRARSNILAVISNYIQLKKSGVDNYVSCCPFHEEKSPSFSVTPNKNFYYCFGCGAGGSAITFVMDYERIGFRDAVAKINGNISTSPSYIAPIPSPVDDESEWQQISPVPVSALMPMDKINRKIDGVWHGLSAVKRWDYLNADGTLHGYMFRFNRPSGGKEVLPQSYCVNVHTGEEAWRWRSFNKLRPIYGLYKLTEHPKAQVICFEGEKAADAGQEALQAAGISLNSLVAISWPGGTKAVRYTDWSPLAGRGVALWPDADQKHFPVGHPKAGQMVAYLDQVGVAAMLDVAATLDSLGCKKIKLITPPDGVPDGWDIADEKPEGFNVIEFVKAALSIADFIEKHKATDTGEVAGELIPEHDYDGETGGSDDGEFDDHVLLNNGYFSILGYDGNRYYFFSHEKRQVLDCSKGDFSEVGLIELAPINWWEESFPAKNGLCRSSAVNWIFRTANARGIYDPTRVRGRGAWYDAGRSVFHHGRFLTVDGVKTEITSIKSGYVYPMARNLRDPDDVMLSDDEGRRLVGAAEMVRWTMPASAALMSGWVMLAPICGALGWRPHIWLTGGPGSGKTTIQNKFCAALLRDISLYAQGDSTEPGIRQKLKADAIPVLIDEAESNNDRDRYRIEALIGLIRKTSSDSQAETFKGTASGEGQNFHVRSMFCLASINVNMPTKADIDRLTKLVIKSPDPVRHAESEAHWLKLESELNAIDLDTGISGRLLSRALTLLPVIQESIKVFRRVAASQFKAQRDGDQFGTLLAGCWSLSNSVVATEDDARSMIERYDFKEHVEDHDQDDAMRALEAILAARIRINNVDYSVYEVIRETSMAHTKNVIGMTVAEDSLRRNGIRVELGVGEIWFGTGVSTLRALVEKMPFVTDLRGQLLRIIGAKRLDKSKKFNGIDSKCISIPLAPILNNSDDLPPAAPTSSGYYLPPMDVDDPF